MNHADIRVAESGDDRLVAESQAELSDTDLESVVGGLARPWTEADADVWMLEPVKSAL